MVWGVWVVNRYYVITIILFHYTICQACHTFNGQIGNRCTYSCRCLDCNNKDRNYISKITAWQWNNANTLLHYNYIFMFFFVSISFSWSTMYICVHITDYISTLKISVLQYSRITLVILLVHN
jgi:hypothetical protein